MIIHSPCFQHHPQLITDIQCKSLRRLKADLNSLVDGDSDIGAVPEISAKFSMNIKPVYGTVLVARCFDDNLTFPDGTTERESRCGYHGWTPAVPLCANYGKWKKYSSRKPVTFALFIYTVAGV